MVRFATPKKRHLSTFEFAHVVRKAKKPRASTLLTNAAITKKCWLRFFKKLINFIKKPKFNKIHFLVCGYAA